MFCGRLCVGRGKKLGSVGIKIVECTACGKPDKYHPAVWVEADNTYQHEVIAAAGKKHKVVATRKMEYCDSTILHMFWSDTHK